MNNQMTKCIKCGDELRYYDTVKRYIKEKEGRKKLLYIQRLKCPNCKTIRRSFPNSVIPHKHYSRFVIEGFLNGYISQDTIGFEDYPCFQTIKRWNAIFSTPLME